jgi:hypothetical protein
MGIDLNPRSPDSNLALPVVAASVPEMCGSPMVALLKMDGSSPSVEG